MKLKLLAFLALWVSIASGSAFAQLPATIAAPGKASISGKVINEDKSPFDLATIALFSLPDTVLLKSTFTEQDGKFILENLKEGAYLLKVSAMGYKNYQTSTLNINAAGQALTVPEVTLLAVAKNLKEVSIVGKKPFIERKIDRTVVNVDALISNAGGTAMDVLEKSPGVIVDQNGTISLKGKQGVAIFIDDKPTYLSGADLESYLKSLPSSSLEQIELMSNPPARYDAAGNGGVINIKTKRTNSRGFNGGLNLAYSQGKLARTNNSFNFNYRNNKFNFFGNLNQSQQNNFTDLDIKRRYKNEDGSTKSYFEQNSYIRRKGFGLNGKVGADYYQNEKTTWGVLITGMHRSSPETNDNVSNLLNASRELDSVVKAFKTEKEIFKNIGFNLNYRHQFDKEGHQLTFDADYLTYKNDYGQVIENYSYLPDQTLKTQDVLNGVLPSDIRIYTAKADYTKPFKNNWKMDAGLKTGYTKTDNTAVYSNTVSGVTTPDYDKSNHFIYKENISSGYLNVSKEMKKWSFQAGLRLEHTNSDGHQLGNLVKPDSAFKREYANLFPTVYVSYKLDTIGNNQIGLNYGRRVDRPYFEQLNPFVSPLDKFTYYLGNPFLNPSFTHGLELSHTYKNKVTTTLGYSDTKDEVNETIEILNGLYYSRPGNIGRKIVKTISVNAGLDLSSWLTWQLYGELTDIRSRSSDFYNGTLNSGGTFFSGNSTLQVKFDKGWSAEVGGMYRSKVTDAQFVVGQLYAMNAGLQKKLSASTTIKMRVSDIFYTRVINGTINNLALTDAGWKNRSDSRTAVISLSYRFGKTMSDLRKHESTGAESEQNRVKQ